MSIQYLELDSVFRFGVHKGKQVEDVIEDHPDYMRWIAEEDVCELDPEVVRKLEQKKII